MKKFYKVEKFSENNFFNKINIKNIYLLDFGCGLGVWTSKIKQIKKIKKILLYDCNHELHFMIKKKYKSNNKVSICSGMFEASHKINVVLFGSVIQYLSLNKLKFLFEKYAKNKNVKYIIMSDIPRLPRLLEFCLLPFFNYKRFIYSIYYLMEKKYSYFKFYRHEFHKLANISKSFTPKKLENFHATKVLRYSIIYEKK